MADEKSDHSAGMFDLNRDGKIDGVEGYLAYRMFERMAKKPSPVKLPNDTLPCARTSAPAEPECPQPPEKLTRAEYRHQIQWCAFGFLLFSGFGLLCCCLPALGFWFAFYVFGFGDSFSTVLTLVFSVIPLYLLIQILRMTANSLRDVAARLRSAKAAFRSAQAPDGPRVSKNGEDSGAD